MENKTNYAYESPDGKKLTNDENICKLLGSRFDYDITTLKKIDEIKLCEKKELPTVSEAGIETCLKLWRMGSYCRFENKAMTFQIVTNKIEYVFSIQDENCSIYCGASVNIPLDGGMLGSGQYFRLRNFADNSKPFCGFYCEIGNDIETPDLTEITCETGQYVNTPQGLYWPVKRYTENEIVLNGCGGDEYI